MPEDLGGDKTHDLPGQGEDASRAQPRADHRVERARPAGRRGLPSREREHPQPDS